MGQTQVDYATGIGICLNPRCYLCYETVINEFNDSEVIWYMNHVHPLPASNPPEGEEGRNGEVS